MKKISIVLCVCIVLLSACSDRRQITRTDTTTSGVAEIVVDETLAPIIQQQVNVFEGLNREATIIPVFTSEIEAYRQFVSDSIRLLIGARELTPGERKIIEERKQTIRSQRLAVDGIALIVNKTNTDTLITVDDLRKVFTGEISTWKELNSKSKLGPIAVSFDSPNSSMARYIKDSICVNKPFGPNVSAKSADSVQSIDFSADMAANQKVIDFVASTPNAMGVIGVNWISNPGDSTNLSFIKKIKVVSVSSEPIATPSNSYMPFPYQLALGKYPLKRDIYIIISDVRGGLPAGFVNFAAGDQGQRIITKAGLLPATRPMRMVRVRPNL